MNVRSRLLLCAVSLLAHTFALAGERVAVWRIEGAGVAPSYLVATPPPEEGRSGIPPGIGNLLGKSRTLVLEMDLDPAALLPALPAAIEANPNRRHTTVDAVIYRRALASLRARGIRGEQLSRLRPWALGLSLGAPPAGTDPLELALLRRAASQKKNLRTLESLAESVTDLETIPVREQEAMIRAGLARGDKAPVMLDELLQAWQAGNAQRMQQLMQATRRQLQPYWSEAHHRRLAARLAILLAEGNVLAVTSASANEPPMAHPLRERGWSVVPVTRPE